MTYFLLTSSGLQVFTKKQQSQLVFPPEVVRFQEILDRKAFEALLKQFFGSSKGSEAILFLDEELIYEKTLENKSSVNLEAEMRFFLGKVPFNSDFLAKKIISLKKQIVLLAAYRDYFQTIIQIARLHGWDIKRVVPLSLFNSLYVGKQMNYTLLSSLARNTRMVEASDMLLEYAIKEDIEEQEGNDDKESVVIEEPAGVQLPSKFTMKAQYLVALISLICFGAAIYFAYPILFPSETPKVTPTPVPTLAVHTTIVPTPVATTAAIIQKGDIKIEILNGSGISGQATLLKNSLIDEGFANIDIGNTSGESVTTSSAVFTSVVSQTIQKEVVQILEQSLATISSSQVATQGGYDIVITSGSSLH